MNIGKVMSLFDGMSCGQLAINALNWAYGEYYASEIDKYAMSIAKKNFPNTKHIGDVRNIVGSDYKDINLLIGGSPCQSFSFAGKRKGMSTKDNVEILSLEQYLKLKGKGFEFEGQSYLFWEYIRILKEVKPKYFLLENVMMSKKWEQVITDVLGVEPVMINSSLVSAQNRKRLYWTNIPNITQPEDKGIVLGDIIEPTPTIRPCAPYTPSSRSLCKQVATALDINGYESLKRVSSLNGKSPTLTTMGGGNTEPKVTINDCNTYRKLTILEMERLQTVPDYYTQGVSKTQAKKMLGNGWTIDVISHILSHIKQI